MSDDWQVPDNLADLIRRLDRTDAWAREIERTAEVRAILTDLIAELRAQHYADQCECGCEQWYECEPCSHISLCPTQEAAVRAEARLREVGGE